MNAIKNRTVTEKDNGFEMTLENESVNGLVESMSLIAR